MKKVRYIWTICNLLIFTNGILSQTIIVNSIDDVNDGVYNTVHCSLREAIMLANTYTQPNISFEIKPATPMPWTILPKTNLPDIKNENSNFQFSIIDTYGSSIAISGELLPGKVTGSDFGLQVDTKGKVDIKKLVFKNFSTGLILKRVDTLIIGGGIMPGLAETGNDFLLNQTDVLLDGSYSLCLFLGNCFGSDRLLTEGVGFGEIGIKSNTSNSNSGKLIIGNNDISNLQCNWFSGHKDAGLKLNGLRNVEITGNFFDTDRSSSPLRPESIKNIQLIDCEQVLIKENYLGANTEQITLKNSKNVHIESNYFGSINYYFEYPMSYGIVLDNCDGITIGKTESDGANQFHGHIEASISAIKSKNISIIYNQIGLWNGQASVPTIKDGILVDESEKLELSGNKFIGTTENCIKITKSNLLNIYKNDFTAYQQLPIGNTGISIFESNNINIGDSDGLKSNIFSRLNKGVSVSHSNSNLIFNYQNSFYCNTLKGFELNDDSNGAITLPSIYKRKSNIVYGRSIPNSLIQIYIHGPDCITNPCQGKTYRGSVSTDNLGYWEYDFNNSMTNSITLTVTNSSQGSSEFSDCFIPIDIPELTIILDQSSCDLSDLTSNIIPNPNNCSYKWTGPDSFSDENKNTKVTKDGWYTLSITNPIWEYVLYDSIYVTLNESTYKLIEQTICEGNIFVIEGHQFDSFNPEGVFISNYKNSVGCDSIITIQLKFIPQIEVHYSPLICPSETIKIGDTFFDYNHPAGIVTIESLNPNQCDSIIFVNLQFLENGILKLDTTLCAGEEMSIFGEKISETEPQKLINLEMLSQSGCDSLVLINAHFQYNKISFLDQDSICPGAINGRIEIKIDASGIGPYNLFLDEVNIATFSDSIYEISGLEGGSYTISLTDVRGCRSEVDTFDIIEFPINVISTDDLIEIELNQSHQIEITSLIPIQQITWSPPDHLSCTDCISPFLIAKEDQIYTYQILDYNGCFTDGSIEIKVTNEEVSSVFNPNIFSPNGDGINDLLEPSYKNAELVNMTVFNRWGGVVYNSNVLFSWNGEINSVDADVGVYVCLISYKNMEGRLLTIKNSVTLVR